MTVQLIAGMRQYTLLIPVAISTNGGDRTVTALHLRPVTWKLERDWQDGLIDGRYGMLEALIERLCVEPYAAIEQLRYPDTEMFRREFLAHLSPAIAGPISRGEYPSPAPGGPAEPDDPYDGGDGGGGVDWPDEPPPAPRPSEPPPAPADDPRMALAEMGPEESLGSPEQQRRAAAAFDQRRSPSDPLDEVRDMTNEKSPLAAAVQRSQTFQPSPRDPFAPGADRQPPVSNPAPPPIPRDRAGAPPTPPPLNLASPGAPAREPIYTPRDGYKPDMAADGLGRALGIGDVT